MGSRAERRDNEVQVNSVGRNTCMPSTAPDFTGAVNKDQVLPPLQRQIVVKVEGLFILFGSP